MIFHSLDFGVFLFLVFTLYWICNHKFQNLILLFSSYFFYSYVNPWFFFLIFSQTLVSFYFAQLIPQVKKNKRLVAFLAISLNLIVLGFFKYFNFFVSNILFILNSFEINTSFESLKIILPVGISFYTFQNIGYLVDVYRKDIKPCRTAINYFIFVSFFPQLVAGPIERAKRLIPQIESERLFSKEQFINGFYLIIWGLFKKLVIADNVAIISNKIFLLNDPDPLLIVVGTLAFCVQIFADFSAYTDIARGAAKLLGFNLIINFRNPYFARSPSDFWKRWHISLSSWIKDYIYIPLGGSRCSTLRWIFNITLTFALMGLWHGANLNFILWGLYHAMLTISYKTFQKMVPVKIKNISYTGILSIPVFFILTNIGWLIFREQDLVYLIKYFNILLNDSNNINSGIAIYLLVTLTIYSSPIILSSIYGYYVENNKNKININKLYSSLIKVLFCLLLYIGILIFRSGEAIDFIYFQF